ncbi:MAG: glutamate-5-semialdehyde dehydrogenase [Pseudomonadota bacterium]
MSAAADETQQSTADCMASMGRAARYATGALAGADAATRNRIIRRTAELIRERREQILEDNAADKAQAQASGRRGAMLDRLSLDEARIDAMAAGLDAVAMLDDPLGQIDKRWERPNGLCIERITVPLGVIGIVYESRPNVTVDAGVLCVKSGNAVILRGGSECVRSNRQLHTCLADALEQNGLPRTAVQFVPTQDREAVGLLLAGLNGNVDVLVPRGGRSLVERVHNDARVPVIGHLDGICHVYLHGDCSTKMAIDIAVNAKMRRTGICGAAETVLVDSACAERVLPALGKALEAAGCSVRGDTTTQRLVSSASTATEQDWTTEYLDAIVAIRVVEDFAAAVSHIATYGSGHTDAIVTNDQTAADAFLRQVDSAIVLHNASTQFADGGEFGMGAEIGIATGRIHARGPVGANELTSYKYCVRGSGQTRPN